MICVKCEVYERVYMGGEVYLKMVNVIIFEKTKLDDMKKEFKERKQTLVVISDKVIL